MITPEIDQAVLDMKGNCIMLNTDAKMEINDDDHRYEPSGGPIEVALLNFLIENGISVHERMLAIPQNYELKLKSPFCSLRKCMTVVYKIDHHVIRVVVKGAPEIVVPLTASIID